MITPLGMYIRVRFPPTSASGVVCTLGRIQQRWQHVTPENRSWKASWLLPCSLLLRFLTLGEATSHVTRTLKQLTEISAREELRPADNKDLREPSWQWILWPQSSLQMRDCEPEPPIKATPRILTHGHCEIIKFCPFKPLICKVVFFNVARNN